MKKILLTERFQQLAGIKPLYELDESMEVEYAERGWKSQVSKIKDNDEALEYAAKHFGVDKDIIAKGDFSALYPGHQYGDALYKIQALYKDPKWKSFTASKPSEPEPEKKKPGFLGKMFGKK